MPLFSRRESVRYTKGISQDYGPDSTWTGNVASLGGPILQGTHANNINISYSTPQAQEKWDECRTALILSDTGDDRDVYVVDKGTEAPYSCDWLLQEQTYQYWVEQSNASQILWVSGSEGTGKTMLSLWLTRQLERQYDRNALVLFWFCDGDDDERNSAVGMLRGLIYQMVRDRDFDTTNRIPKEIEREKKDILALREIVLKQYREKKDKMFVLDTLWKVFQTMIKAVSHESVVIVLDGAEKCGHEPFEKLMKRFRAHFTQASNSKTPARASASTNTTTNLKLIVLARICPSDLSDDLSDLPYMNIESSPYYPSGLQVYIDARIEELARSHHYDYNMRDSSTKVLQEGPRSFLWIKQKAQQLRKASPAQILDQASRPADALDGIYVQALRNIPSDWASRCAVLFRWIDGAYEYLTVEEMTEALNVDDAYIGDDQLEIEDIRSLLSICDELVEINASDGTIRFAHSSIPDLLTQDEPWSLDDYPELSVYYFNKADNSASIAYCCVSYLCGGCLDDRAFHGMTDSEEDEKQFASFLERQKQDFPFLNYTSRWLVNHLISCASDDRVFDWTFFHLYSAQRDAWWATYRHLELFNVDDLCRPPLQFPLVHTAAYIGCTPLLNSLDGLDLLVSALYETDSKKTRALTYAIYQGHDEIVEFLLNRGAPHLETQIPLVLVAVNTYNDYVVELFLKRGADANTVMPTVQQTKDLWYQLSPLVISVLDFPEDGQSFDEPIEDGETLLHIAATSGRTELVSALLQHDAVVNVRTTGGITPLHCAASTGDGESVTNLLDRGADALNITSNGWTLLHAAADGELDLEVFQRLHRSGIDANARNRKGETALHRAANYDQYDMIEYLIDSGVHANTTDLEGWSPLHQNLQLHVIDNSDIIELLLRNGADPNQRIHDGRSPIHMALRSDYGCDTEIVRALLNHGSDPNMLDKDGRTALHVSIDYNIDCTAEVIQLLIDHGGDLQRLDAKGITPYQMLKEHDNPTVQEVFEKLPPQPALSTHQAAQQSVASPYNANPSVNGHSNTNYASYGSNAYKDPGYVSQNNTYADHTDLAAGFGNLAISSSIQNFQAPATSLQPNIPMTTAAPQFDHNTYPSRPDSIYGTTQSASYGSNVYGSPPAVQDTTNLQYFQTLHPPSNYQNPATYTYPLVDNNVNTYQAQSLHDAQSQQPSQTWQHPVASPVNTHDSSQVYNSSLPTATTTRDAQSSLAPGPSPPFDRSHSAPPVAEQPHWSINAAHDSTYNSSSFNTQHQYSGPIGTYDAYNNDGHTTDYSQELHPQAPPLQHGNSYTYGGDYQQQQHWQQGGY